MARGRDLFDRGKPLLILAVRLLRALPMSLRKRMLQSARDLNGLVGLAGRYVLCRSIVSECGDNVAIFPGVFLMNIDRLSIGNNVSIHPMCYVDATGGVTIGDDVSIAHGVTIMSFEHGYARRDVPIRDQLLRSDPTRVETGCWIGARAVILAGAVVGRGSIVGAGSVVTRSVEPNSIVGGVPARLIKTR